jgi:23S rRNA pseudouridine1911/1915/1917 synthase
MKGIFGPERPLVKELLEILPRQALHAYSLEFEHPATGERLSLQSDMPEDYAAVVGRLEG